MYEKTKKEIYNLIKLNTESIDWKTPEIVTTGEISRQLNIRFCNVSKNAD